MINRLQSKRIATETTEDTEGMDGNYSVLYSVAKKIRQDNSALSEVPGVVLIIGILVTAFSIVCPLMTMR